MKHLLFFLGSCLMINTLAAQVRLSNSRPDNSFRYKNSIQFEAGGHGIIYSINYERNLLNFNHFKTSAQLGFSFYPAPIDLRSRLWIPFSLNQLFSLRQHHIELGMGFVLTQFQNYLGTDEEFRYNSKFELHPTFKAGYRYQKPGGKMVYKALFTPMLLNDLGTYEFKPLGSIVVGYNF